MSENEIVIFGGSFDPVHTGHLIIAQILMKDYKIKKIVFMPCAQQPLKKANHAEPRHRLKMLSFALEKIKGSSLDDYEIKKGGKSYTVETLNHYKNLYKKVSLLVGADSFYEMEKWQKSGEIFSKVHKIYVYKRREKAVNKNKISKKAFWVDGPAVDISSTLIRKRVKQCKTIKFLVAEEVERYIAKNGLYS